MTTNESIESKLDRLAETVSLRADEKAAHRTALMTFMAQTKAPRRSPYAWLVRHGAQVSAALLVLLVSTGGVASAAESARPGDPLYVVKLRVTEPARTALIFDREKKTAFKLERADRRLKEVALVAATENPDPETTALIADSLADNIAEVSEDVATLSRSADTSDEAHEANSDLQSVLEAHGRVLRTISEKNPNAADDVAAVTASVDAGIAASENAEQEIEETLEPALATDEPVSEQASDTQVSLSTLLTQLEEQSASIDPADRAAIDESLSVINETIAEAWAAREAGERKEAYLLYIEADEQLAELTTLVEADRDLGVGILDEEPAAAE